MLGSAQNFNITSTLIIIYAVFLAWRSPDNATYIPGIASILLFLLYGKFKLQVYIGIVAVTISILFLSLFQDGDITGPIKVLSCLTAFFLMKRLTKEVSLFPPLLFKRIFKNLIWFVVVYLVVEVILRIFYGHLFYDASLINSLDYGIQDLYSLGFFPFYSYKDGSPFFTDSNFTGLFIFIWFIVFVHFKEVIFSKKIAYFLTFLFLVLAFLTFSRTLYAAILLVYIGFMLLGRLTKFWAMAIYVVVGLIMGWFLLYFGSFLADDASLQTKFGIWGSLINNFIEVDLFNQLFGFGLIEGKYVFSYEFGKSSHALIPQLFGDIGIIGTLIYCSLLFLIFAKVEKGFLYFMAIMLMGSSLFDPWDPVYFAAMGILSAVPNIKKFERNYL